MMVFLVYYFIVIIFIIVTAVLFSLLYNDSKNNTNIQQKTNINDDKNITKTNNISDKSDISNFKYREIDLPTSYVNGKTGENKVRMELFKLNEKEYLILNDCTFKVNDRTTQIDHIIVSKYGIFVIETKNYNNCYIKGKNIDKSWTYISGGKKYFLENPVHQNNIHVQYLKRLLRLPEDVFIPFVCICGENCKLDIEYGKTITINNLIKTILSFKDEVLPDYKMVYEKLKYYNIYDIKIKKQHVDNIKNTIKTKNKVNDKKCPWCRNGILVKRESEYGKFYGCSNYPKCEYTKDIK